MWGNFGQFAVSARNCLTSMFKYIIMQMRKVNCEKGYWPKIAKSSWRSPLKISQKNISQRTEKYCIAQNAFGITFSFYPCFEDCKIQMV